TGCDTFTGSHYATAARGTNCPAFCYRIYVTNCSDAGVSLINLVMTDTDSKLNLATCGFPTTLTPPGTPGDHFSCDLPRIEDCNGTIGTVTARATGVRADGTTISNVQDSDTTTNVVTPINVECTKEVSIDGGTPTQSAVMPDATGAHNVA